MNLAANIIYNDISLMNNTNYFLLNYKEEMQENEIITRLKILRLIFFTKVKQKDLAYNLNIHKNTINNLVKLFKSNKQNGDLEIIEKLSKYKFKMLEERFSYLSSKSRKPKSHKDMLDSNIENIVIDIFNNTNKWIRWIYLLLKRKYKNDLEFLSKISIWKIKWVFKRNNLKCKKVRTYNREHRSPFDFQNTMIFSRLYVDIKHLADKHALPKEIYDKFKYSKILPWYMLNVFEQNCRIRFTAYLYELDSFLIRQFIEYVCLFIRWRNLLSIEHKIIIWMDNWFEFTCNSDRKLNDWNNHMKYLNVEFYTYFWPKDPRKNLIERSHKSDDEEFIIPRWYFINSKKDFLKEALDYQYYWNFERLHTWKFMHNLTPVNRAYSSWIYNIIALKDFPLLILQDHYLILDKIKKSQNVLTYYLFKLFLKIL